MKKFFIIAMVFIFALTGLWSGEASSEQKVIVLDPGHSTKGDLKKEAVAPGSKTMKYKETVGTQGVVTKVPEYKVNLDVAKQLQKELEKRGYKVYLTKTTYNQSLSNQQRAKFANKKKADLVIRLHCDGSEDKGKNGVSMLVPGNSGYVAKHQKISKKYGEKILKYYVEKTGLKNNGIVTRTDLTGFNWSNVPVVLLEMGFMSNSKEDRYLNKADNQKKIVQGIANGIDDCF